MNDIFARTNQELSQSAEANDLSFTRESDEGSTEGDSDAANNIYLSNGKKSGLGDKQTTKLVVASNKKPESYVLPQPWIESVRSQRKTRGFYCD